MVGPTMLTPPMAINDGPPDESISKETDSDEGNENEVNI